MKFDVVVANPPFSLDKWGADSAQNDRYRRFHRGVPPKSRGDYAFISHMIESSIDNTGKVGVIVPHGVLFRGGSEGIIRRKLVQENLLEAVIGLPPNLFYGTGIPTAILLFNRAKQTSDVLFVDASREYEDAINQNRLRDEDIRKIVDTFRSFQSKERYAHRASSEDIEENDFNLNIPRYVDTFVEDEEIDLRKVSEEIADIEKELRATYFQVDALLKELGYGKA